MWLTRLKTDHWRQIPLWAAMLGLLAACDGGPADATATDAGPAAQETAGSADIEAVNEVLELAYQGIGGKPSLMNLAGFSAVSTRDRYVMGMGIEPGNGLFKSVSSAAQTSYDLGGERLRQDFRHANLYGLIVEVTELIVEGAGYSIGRDDIYGEARLAAAPLNSGRMAMALKTERLLNPHILLRQTLEDPSIASLGMAEFPDTMVVLSEQAVYPIALTFDGATNFRRMLTNEQWLQKWGGTDLVQLATNGDIVVDGQWFERWQAPPATGSWRLSCARHQGCALPAAPACQQANRAHPQTGDDGARLGVRRCPAGGDLPRLAGCGWRSVSLANQGFGCRNPGPGGQPLIDRRHPSI